MSAGDKVEIGVGPYAGKRGEIIRRYRRTALVLAGDAYYCVALRRLAVLDIAALQARRHALHHGLLRA